MQLSAAGLAWLAAGRPSAAASSYRVGLGHLPDPYAATVSAVEACAEWPADQIVGRRVVIKPNLVWPMPLEAGATTDAQVVRALVDLSLEAGASQVQIVEGGFFGACFSQCGYDFFNDYDPQGRVSLVDLSWEPVTLAAVNHGMVYKRIYMPQLLLEGDPFFISAAKLKTHYHTHATLSVKNLVGLPPVQIYQEGLDQWRWVMHYRGISQVIVDLNLLRPIDFAVVDGVIGMEGEGPIEGTPVQMDLVVAGRNAVAVDRACMWAMDLPQGGAKHLTYASRRGLGPAGMDEIELVGDPITPRPFAWPTTLPPLLEYPMVMPAAFVPSHGQQTKIVYSVFPACRTKVEVVLTSELSPEVTVIRTLHGLVPRPAGPEVLFWDGRDDDGHIVPPHHYMVRVMANYEDDVCDAYASSWVRVLPGAP